MKLEKPGVNEIQEYFKLVLEIRGVCGQQLSTSTPMEVLTSRDVEVVSARIKRTWKKCKMTVLESVELAEEYLELTK